MEFTIRRSYFLDRLALVARGVAVHSPMEMLNGILIQIKDNMMVLTGSDTNFTIQTVITPDEENLLEISQAGSLVIEARMLLELIRRMTGEMISVNSPDGQALLITGPDGNFELVGKPGSEYVIQPLTRPENHVQLPTEVLKSIYEHCAYATSERNSRQVLQGINLEIADGRIAATATDSIRLARQVVPVETDAVCRITVPTGPLGEVTKSLGNVETVDLYCDRRKVQFIFDNTLMQITLYEGNFPDATRIIPTKYISTLKMRAADLEGMLNRTSIYTSAASSQTGTVVPVQFKCSAEGLGMRVLSSEVGSCKQVFTDLEYTGEDITVSFNAKLMIEALRGLRSSDQVELDFTGELRPIKITNPDDPTLTMVIVPIRSNV